MVEFISTEGWNREKWYAYRHDGIGASEVGTILGFNQYQCSLELFHLKIGRAKPKPMNLRMNIGHIGEQLIGELWEYWEADKNKFNDNIKNRRKVRECEPVNGYMRNDKYPNLFVSLDRRFKDPRFEGYCNLELKNKTSLSYKQFTEEMNPMEVTQLATQNLVSEYVYGEIAYFIDNTWIEVMPITYKDALKMEKVILKATNKFWDSVLKARIIVNQIEYAKSNYQMSKVADLEMELLQLEPEPENNQAYYDYLTTLARAKKEEVPIKGSNVEYEIAKKIKSYSEKRKKMEAEEIKLKSLLISSMRTMDKHEIDFGKQGKVSFWSGTFKNNIK